MAEMKNQAKQKASRPARKSALTKSIFVVKDGVRKARSIRKFQDSYYVGLAYVGLMQLDKGIDENGNPCWKGKAVVENPVSNIRVYVEIYNHYKEWSPKYVDSAYVQNEDGTYYNRDDLWSSHREYTSDEIDLWRNNMEGISESSFKFEISYYADSLTGSANRVKRVFEYESDYDYPSIEDVLDAVEQKSEEAWGDVNIYLTDNAKTYQNIRETEAQYPSTVQVMLPTGESITLSMNDYDTVRMGNWHGSAEFSEDGIFGEVKIRIRAVTSDGNGGYSDESDDFEESYRYDTYRVNRDNTLEYYAVDVIGEITDGNTQVNEMRGQYERSDSWERKFVGEGSQTLEGAIAIAESNIAEVYNEWSEYVHSVRNYVMVGHGQGYRRTTENTEPWDYNFGDTREDMRYDDWQSYDEYNPESPVSVTGTEWDEMNYWSDKDNDAKIFAEEYLGTGLSSALKYDYDRGDNRLYFKESNWMVGTDKRSEIKGQKTRDDVERVANYMGLKLVDYTDPLNFVLSKGVKKRVRKSKMPYAYYDVEVRRLQRQGLVKSKQAQPKSFNDMVKSIRTKNNQHKKRM